MLIYFRIRIVILQVFFVYIKYLLYTSTTAIYFILFNILILK